MSHTERIETIEHLACSIKARRLVAPAIFMLELSKPLVGCMRELYSMSESLQNLLFGSELVPAAKDLLSSPKRIEDLIVLLEQERDGAASGVRG